MPANFRVYAVDQFKSVGVQFVKHLDNLKPNGNGYNEVDMVRYVTASSPSAFIGIQKPSQSRFALNSMIKSLESHAVGNTFDRPWLLKNLEFLGDYTKYNPSSMEREYGDLLLKAKTSSSSIPGAPNFRDFVFQNDINDIYNVTNMNVQNTIPYLMIAGTRTDRRGKFRLVFSMPAQFRILDFLYTNGSYALCMEGGPLAQYTTEGYNSAQM